jgi:hypothetical protein
MYARCLLLVNLLETPGQACQDHELMPEPGTGRLDRIAEKLTLIRLGEAAAEQVLVKIERKPQARAQAKTPDEIDQTTEVRVPGQERSPAALMKNQGRASSDAQPPRRPRAAETSTERCAAEDDPGLKALNTEHRGPTPGAIPGAHKAAIDTPPTGKPVANSEAESRCLSLAALLDDSSTGGQDRSFGSIHASRVDPTLERNENLGDQRTRGHCNEEKAWYEKPWKAAGNS